MQTERKAFNKNKKRILDAVANLGPGDYLRIRRLVPRESLRLMGLTDEQASKMIYDSKNSEVEIYKEAGNSIVCDPMYHIFRRLFLDRSEPDEGQSYTLY